MSAAAQPELDFTRPAAEPSAADRVAELARALEGRDWVTARELGEMGFKERELRELAESDDGVLLFSHPGSRGYKLFREVTVEEFRHGIGALWSQIKLMTRRVLRYLKAWHRLGREAPRP